MQRRLVNAASLLLTLSLAACGGGGGGGDGDGGGNGGGETTTTLRNTTTTSVFRPTTTTVGGPGTTLDTTTTLGAPGSCPANNRVRCTATFRVTNNVTLGGLQFVVDYEDVNGCFQGQADNVECSSASGVDAIATFNDEDSEQRLSAAFASVSGIDAPADVAVCDFIAAGSPPSPNDFAVDVIESVTPDLTPRVANVDVIIDCDGGGGGTTTTTTGGGGTTTTNGPTTTSTVEERDTEFDVVLRLADAATVGSLQLTIDYTQAPGDFRGSGASEDEGGSLECTSLVSGALVSFNDDDEGTLTAGFVSLEGFTGPTDLATCVFDRFGFGTVLRNQFTVSIDSVTDPDVNPIDPPPDVIISRIVPR
jgi:hypothetical protein